MEHADGLVRLGLDVARQISGNSAGIPSSQPSSIYKLANVVWAGICNVWSEMSLQALEELDAKGSVASTQEICCALIACMDRCLESAQHGAVDDETGSKVLKFLVSNFGKIVKCGSSEAADGNIIALWSLLLSKGCTMDGKDVHDSIGLTYRAFAVCLNKIDSSKRSVFLKRVCLELVTGNKKQNVFRSVCKLWKASEKMEADVLKDMVPVMVSMFKFLTLSKIQEFACSHPGDIIAFEDALIHYVSYHLEVNVETGMQAIYSMIGFITCPHPLLENVMSRFSMRIMSCAGDALQLAYLKILVDVMNHAVSLEYDAMQSPAVEQCVAVVSASISCASPATIGSLLRSIDNVPEPQPSADVFKYARIAVFLRVLHLSCASHHVRALRSAESLAEIDDLLEMYAQKILNVLVACIQLYSKRSSEDEILLLLWMTDCLYWTSSFSPGKKPLRMRNDGMALNATLETCFRDLVTLVLAMSEHTKSHQVLTIMTLLERMGMQISQKNHQRFSKPSSATGKKQNISILDRFDPSNAAAGWLVQIATQQHQRPLGAMKKLFHGTFEGNATAPLQHLGINSYIEYIHYASEENITSVLPQSKLNSVTGTLSEDFKKEVEKYVAVIKNIPSPQEVDFEMKEIQKSILLGDIWDSLSEQCLTRYSGNSAVEAQMMSPKAMQEQSCGEDKRLTDALEHAKKSLKNLVSMVESTGTKERPTTAMKRTLDDMQCDLTWLKSQV